MNPDIVQLVLVTIVTAATPLFIAAVGELVAERSGVLNLGVEGMMIVGASVGFAVAYMTDSTVLGALAGTASGVLMAALFAVLVIGLAANQVASGLALTIFGIGVSGLIGSGFVGQKRTAAQALWIPGLSDLPIIGRLFFGEDLFVYAGIALIALVAYFISRTRAGLTLRAVGDNHTSAHVLGLSVGRIRLLAVLFGGGCAGLAGSYLSLVYTPFWSPGMTAGRGWIALALVVFASWRPWRVLGGALLFGGATVLQLHAQAFGIGLPGQLLSSVPYAATVLALIVLSWRNRRGAAAPAMLGMPFISDR
ncbi:ABC transporter permease [Lichenihabitans psoromatis]|uniref:ABC transporter permease n=1 Tax=Lichenihabitans psoromatis TaxID=2528642 RepID=UPI001036369A|nr:ABC transporter permease [Lichenihabitans psoromatis]